MLEETISRLLKTAGLVWRIGGKYYWPTPEDVRGVLDKTASTLYDTPVGTQLETTGLRIEKAAKGHDVYVYVGNYE